ncbi:MAG: UDP-N-acetylglucosamine 1-carboxyvinyltransferase [Oscillospiraceae bacterium]|nr:UDP-N-acetylglucosamine 1-carboxyvinyltransferase [Oscillospiraceae bacterium]
MNGLITVTGGRRLSGEVTVQGAKNSVLPILAATILSGDTCRIRRCPRLFDVETTVEILRHLGCRVWWEGEDLLVDTAAMSCWDIPDRLMRKMRSSVIFLGAILARCGEAEMSYPGGCELGPRPIDLHLTALQTLGAAIEEHSGVLRCEAQKLLGAEIVLSLPSVGATENAILAACGAEGVTTISNAAREPEICDLQDFLCAMGADVRGAGSSTVTVTGGRRLHGCEHQVIADRIVAATYLAAAAGAGGDICLKDVQPRHLTTVTAALQQAGCRITGDENTLRLESRGKLHSIPLVRTAPYPGFPTDAQAVLMAALLCSRGTTVFVENMFENRYRHVAELRRMGADVRPEGRVAVVCGVERLRGAQVHATDLRGGAALVVAGLQAEGTTQVGTIHHIQRGYADIVGDLSQLGAEICRQDT